MRRLDVDRMLRQLSASQFAEWRAARQLGAFDTVANADHRAGVIAANVANWAGKTRRKGARDYRARDMIPSRIPAPPPTEEEAQEQIKSMFRDLGAKRRSAKKGTGHGRKARR